MAMSVCAASKRERACLATSFRLRDWLPPDNASFHSCDLWYALGSLPKSLRPFTEQDYALSDEMVDRFAEFAKTSNPNVKGKPQWKTYSSKSDIKVFD